MNRPPPPPGPSPRELQRQEVGMHANPLRGGHNYSKSVPLPVDADRKPPVKKQRRLSSRQLMAQNGIGDGISKQSKPAPVPQSANVVRGKHARADTTGHSLPASLPQHPDIKLQVTPKERNKNYRRGSITERYRRASVFNEIIKAQQDAASSGSNMENGDGHAGGHNRNRGSSMTDTIQHTQAYGINTQHRSRIMAFEKVAHHIGTDHDDFIINPYCVASMPEPIRKAFVIKVCGIVLSQMLLMVTVICIIKYSGLGAEIIKGYTMWSLLTTFIPLFFLAMLMGVRKSHPWNLLVFSLFTLSWAYSLGIACVWLENRLFISVMGLSAMNTLGIMGFARFVSYDKFNCCNCTMVVGFLSFITIFISYGIYPDEPWGNHIWPAFISLIFGSWICWDLKALQIDLTADEYIIGAVDLYLDILNMFLWALICCLHCFETILKG